MHHGWLHCSFVNFPFNFWYLSTAKKSKAFHETFWKSLRWKILPVTEFPISDDFSTSDPFFQTISQGIFRRRRPCRHHRGQRHLQDRVAFGALLISNVTDTLRNFRGLARLGPHLTSSLVIQNTFIFKISEEAPLRESKSMSLTPMHLITSVNLSILNENSKGFRPDPWCNSAFTLAFLFLHLNSLVMLHNMQIYPAPLLRAFLPTPLPILSFKTTFYPSASIQGFLLSLSRRIQCNPLFVN